MPTSTARVNPVGVLDPNDPYDGLTAKQQVFVAMSFSGMSDIEAYRQAYDCSGMNVTSIGRQAANVAHHPMVTAKIRQLQDNRDSQSTLASSLTREWIQQRLMKLADNAEKDTVKVTALIALGKVVGIDLFRETTRVERIERTPADIDRELEEQLRSMTKTIEGRANAILEPEKPKADRRRKPGAR